MEPCICQLTDCVAFLYEWRKFLVSNNFKSRLELKEASFHFCHPLQSLSSSPPPAVSCCCVLYLLVEPLASTHNPGLWPAGATGADGERKRWVGWKVSAGTGEQKEGKTSGGGERKRTGKPSACTPIAAHGVPQLYPPFMAGFPTLCSQPCLVCVRVCLPARIPASCHSERMFGTAVAQLTRKQCLCSKEVFG